MDEALERFVKSENIKRLTKQIEAATDPAEIKRLRRLLADEEADGPLKSEPK